MIFHGQVKPSAQPASRFGDYNRKLGVHAGLLTRTGIRIGIFLFGMFLYSRSPFEIGWDLTGYLAIAKNIAIGHAFASFDGKPATDRPAIELLLAFVLKATDFSLPAVAWTIFALNALLGVMLFDFGRRLYDWRVGIVSALAFLASHSLLVRNPQIVDPTWPILVIASYLIVMTNTRFNRLIAVTSAITIVTAGLVKIFALFALPIPILALMLDRKPNYNERGIWYGATLFGLCFAWVVLRSVWFDGSQHVLSDEERLYSAALKELMQGYWISDNDIVRLVNSRDSMPSLNLSFIGLVTVAKYLIVGAWSYFTGPDGLWQNLPYSWFQFGSILVIAWWAITARLTRDIVLLAFFFAFIPFIAVCGTLEYRYTQAMIFIALFYIATAATLASILDRLTSRRWISSAASISLAALIVIHGASEWSTRSVFLPGGPVPFQIKTWHEYDNIAPRVMASTDEGMIVATNNGEMASLLSFRYGTQIRIERLPLDPSQATNWIQSNLPDRIIVATGEGSASYPPGLVQKSKGYHQLPFDDESRYVYQFFARDTAR